MLAPAFGARSAISQSRFVPPSGRSAARLSLNSEFAQFKPVASGAIATEVEQSSATCTSQAAQGKQPLRKIVSFEADVRQK